MDDPLGPMSVIFSTGGAAVLGSLAEALAKARTSGCDCDTYSMLRAAQGALDDIVDGHDG